MSEIQTIAPQGKAAKIQELEKAQVVIEKEHGAGTLQRLGKRTIVPVDVIPTGVFELDHGVIQAGGVPRGRIVEIYGPEASGKTTWALQVIAQVQAADGTAAYIDAEQDLDPGYAKKLGVNVNDLFLCQPEHGEQGLQIAEALIDTSAVDVIVIDSVAALVPRAELEGDIGDSNVGLHARLMSQAMRILRGKVRRTNTCLIFINQIREKIGVMFGSPETTTGGRALKFYASLRLDIRRIGQIKDGETIIGNRTRIKAVKNKIGSPYRECEVDLIYGEGIDGVASLLNTAVKFGVIDKAGAWFSFAGERLGQGARNSAQMIRETPEMRTRIEAATLKALRTGEE